MVILKAIFIFLFCFYNVTAQITTVAAVVPCSASYSTYCKNSGFCVVLFGNQISCTCPVGFTGILVKNFVKIFEPYSLALFHALLIIISRYLL